MKRSEDVKISLRGIRRKPLETLLLVIGIALGIGATAAGISMVSSSIQVKNAVLDSTEYKEIVVQVREDADDMDLAAAPTLSDGGIILSWEDLAAKNDVGELEYGYLAAQTEFRLANFGSGRPPESSQSPDETAAVPAVEGPQPALDAIAGLRVSPEYFPAWSLTPAAGGLFTQEEMVGDAKVMVLGATLGETLFDDGVALGRDIRVFQSIYTIVGVLEPMGTSIDETAIVPAEAANVAGIQESARRLFGGGATLHFTVHDSTRLDEAKAQLDLWFGQQYGEGRVAISIPREEVEAAQDRSSRLISVILFLAVAGLLIASVNVSNILLGRAMKRRRSVGVLKALGASMGNVFSLFFLEAFVIGAAGAVLGVGVSMLISSLTAGAMAGGAVISVMLFIGIFGAWIITAALTVFPALQASRIPAADALRYQ